MKSRSVKLTGRAAREAGATIVEYALLAAVLALVLVGAITVLEGGITSAFQDQQSNIEDDPGFVTVPPGSGGPGETIFIPIEDDKGKGGGKDGKD